MTIPQVKAIDSEREFGISELLFSTTDCNGIIRYGNKVFSRIADYELENMLGKPHNLIRHPDMPRAVFQVLWDYLHAGEVIAAYVKNLASDGRYYWVMALVVPCEGGYLSIRLKPSSPVFDVVKSVYVDVLKIEQEIEAQGGANARKRAIDAGINRILELLKGKGFNNYDEFMWSSFAKEMMSREDLLESSLRSGKIELLSNGVNGQEQDSVELLRRVLKSCGGLDEKLRELLLQLGDFEQLHGKLLKKSDFVLNLAESIRRFSINAVIEACRLQDSGNSLTVIAETMGRSSHESSTIVDDIIEGVTSISAFFGEMTFNLIQYKLQVEVILVFVNELLAAENSSEETDSNEFNLIKEHIEILIKTAIKKTEEAIPLLAKLHKVLSRVDGCIGDLQRFVRSMKFIQFAGTVEAARCEDAESFALIFDEALKKIDEAQKELGEFSSFVGENMSKTRNFEHLSNSIEAEMKALLRIGSNVSI